MRVDRGEEPTPQSQERSRQLFVVIGVLLALVGSYLAIEEAFSEPFCNALGCVETRSVQNLWLGLVLAVIGVVVVWRNWRRT